MPTGVCNRGEHDECRAYPESKSTGYKCDCTCHNPKPNFCVDCEQTRLNCTCDTKQEADDMCRESFCTEPTTVLCRAPGGDEYCSKHCTKGHSLWFRCHGCGDHFAAEYYPGLPPEDFNGLCVEEDFCWRCCTCEDREHDDLCVEKHNWKVHETDIELDSDGDFLVSIIFQCHDCKIFGEGSEYIYGSSIEAKDE